MSEIQVLNLEPRTLNPTPELYRGTSALDVIHPLPSCRQSLAASSRLLGPFSRFHRAIELAGGFCPHVPSVWLSSSKLSRSSGAAETTTPPLPCAGCAILDGPYATS